MSSETTANDSTVVAVLWRAVTWLARIGIVCVVGFLCIRGVREHHREPVVDLAAWDFEEGAEPLDVVGRFAASAGIDALWFALVGLLAPAAIGAWLARRQWLARVAVMVPLGVVLAALVRGAELGAVPSPALLILPMSGYLPGAWIGATALRGVRAMLWLVPKMAIVVVLLAASVAAVGMLALDGDALPFEPGKVTAAQKRHLADAVRGTRTGADDPRLVELTDGDVDLLLAVGLSRGSTDRKARVRFDDGAAAADVSLKLPAAPAAAAFLNAQVGADVAVTDGRLELRLTRARIGRLNVPPAALRFLSPAISSAVLRDPDLKLVMCSIQSLRPEKGAVRTVFMPCEFSSRVVPSMARRLGGKPDVLAETQDHARRLIAIAPKLSQGDARLAAFVEQAFRFAQSRSEHGDPALQNRAALLALAVLLGHGRVEALVGPVLDENERKAAAQNVGKVTLRGRSDWTKHFFVSASLALVGSEQFSDKIGLLKEELDAERGGSGFSFSDLAADRAGTLLAKAATRDEPSARAVQARFAAGFVVDDVFPPAADLPEGISADDLKSRYGGVEGPGFREIQQEIERRLQQCAALR